MNQNSFFSKYRPRLYLDPFGAHRSPVCSLTLMPPRPLKEFRSPPSPTVRSQEPEPPAPSPRGSANTLGPGGPLPRSLLPTGILTFCQPTKKTVVLQRIRHHSLMPQETPFIYRDLEETLTSNPEGPKPVTGRGRRTKVTKL